MSYQEPEKIVRRTLLASLVVSSVSIACGGSGGAQPSGQAGAGGATGGAGGATSGAGGASGGAGGATGGAGGATGGAGGATGGADAGGADAGGADAGGADAGDGSPDAPSDSGVSQFGKQIGTDSCVPPGAGYAPAWTMDRRCKARTGQSPVVSTQTGAVVYSQGVGDGYASSSFPGETTFAADGTIYANGEVINALDPATYATKWKWGSPHFPPVASPNGAVIVMDPTVTPGLVSLNPATGAVNWSLKFPKYYVGAATVLADGSLAFVAGLSELLVLNAADGSAAWSVDVGPPGKLAQPPLVVGANGTIYVNMFDKIRAVSTATQKISWTAPTAVKSSIALDERDQRLYFLHLDGGYSKVGSLSATDGTGLAHTSYKFTAGNSTSNLALGESGWVYFISNGQLQAINTQTQAHWEHPVTGSCSDPVVGGDGTVYFAETSGSGVAAVAVTAAGALRWKKVLGPTLDPSSPGSFVTIAPSGHLAITAAANSTFYLLGP